MKRIILVILAMSWLPLGAVTTTELGGNLQELSERVNELIAQGKSNSEAINELLGRLEQFEQQYSRSSGSSEVMH